MNDYKTIPFDIKKAKTPENPDGLEVVTKDGRSVRIVFTKKYGTSPIVALVSNNVDVEDANEYKINGYKDWGYDGDVLVLKEPVKQRRMTNMELSKWLREKPEEFREVTNQHNLIGSNHIYSEDDKNMAVRPDIMIRSNYGEWKEPLIEI